MNNKYQIEMKAGLFVKIILLSYCIHILLFWIFNSSYQLNIFFSNCSDFFADFFNLVRFSSNRNFYVDSKVYSGLAGYLPLSYVLLYPFQNVFDFSGLSLQACWASPVAITCALFFTAISLVLFISSLLCLIKRYNISRKLLIPFIIGHITINSLERGNWIIITAACIYYFLSFYDSNVIWKKYLAATCLVFASVFKVYPVIFGILYVKRKDYRMVCYCFLSGILLTFLPFLGIKGGFSSVSDCIASFKGHYGYVVSSTPKFSTTYLIYILNNFFKAFFSFEIPSIDLVAKIFSVLTKIICIYSLFLVLKIKDIFYEYLLIAFSVLYLHPHSEFYCGLYLYPALIFYFIDMSSRKRYESVLWFFFFVVLFQDVQIVFLFQKTWLVNVTKYIVSVSVVVMFLFSVVLCARCTNEVKGIKINK